MLRTDLADYRRSTDSDLLDGLRRADALALAEAYHRTIPAAHACARRLLSASGEVEALLRTIYSELWASPPHEAPLEGWVRSRSFALGADHLRERGSPPAIPSLSELLPDLPATEARYLDAAERAVSELPPEERRALLRAHDAGLPTHEHGSPGAADALERALVKLAGSEEEAEGCMDLDSLGDFALGLVGGSLADAINAQLSTRPECSQRMRLLRRGRRRLEGLPPTPDMGQRILAVVLASRPAAVAGPPPAEAAPPAPATAPPEPPEPAGVEQPRSADEDTAGDEALPSALDDDSGQHDASLSDVIGAEEAPATGPYEELAALDEQAQATALADESDGELLAPPDEDEDGEEAPARSMGARALRVLGYLVLLALGAIVGLYVGSWFVAAR